MFSLYLAGVVIKEIFHIRIRYRLVFESTLNQVEYKTNHSLLQL